LSRRGQTLVPILTGRGAELRDPMVATVHDAVKG